MLLTSVRRSPHWTRRWQLLPAVAMAWVSPQPSSLVPEKQEKNRSGGSKHAGGSKSSPSSPLPAGGGLATGSASCCALLCVGVEGRRLFQETWGARATGSVRSLRAVAASPGPPGGLLGNRLGGSRAPFLRSAGPPLSALIPVWRTGEVPSGTLARARPNSASGWPAAVACRLRKAIRSRRRCQVLSRAGCGC